MPAINLDGMEDAAIDGAFAVALAGNPAGKGGNDKQRQQATGTRGDGADQVEPTAKTAEQKYRERLFTNNVNPTANAGK